MSLDFTLYEIITHNDVEVHNIHKVKEVLFLSNFTAMLITEWFYHKNGKMLHDNIRENGYYIECYGYTLIELKKHLNMILSSEDEVQRNLLALNYFPTTFVEGYYVNEVEIFSDEYYSRLILIYEKLKDIMPNDNIDNHERLFVYKVSW